MSNNTTQAQRTNAKHDKIFEEAKELKTKRLIDFLLENVSASYYDAINELYKNYIKDKSEEVIRNPLTRDEIVKRDIEEFLSNYNIEEWDLIEYKKGKNDFWNDMDKDGRCWCDIANEQADGKVSIYNETLWEEAAILQDWIEDAISEFGIDGCGIKERGIIGLFQSGQYKFWSEFYNEIMEGLKKYTENLSN